MRRVGFSFLVFLFAVVFSIPVSLSAANGAFAEDLEFVIDKDNKNMEGKEVTFFNDFASSEWTMDRDGDVRMQFWYDIAYGFDDDIAFYVTVKLQKKKENGEFEDTGQQVVRRPLDKDTKQEDILFRGLKKGETYRILFDGILARAIQRHRISFKLFHEVQKTNDYELKAHYQYIPDKDDELKFSIVKKGQDVDLDFNGKVNVEIIPESGEKVSETRDVTSKESKTFKIDKFVDKYLPTEKKPEDQNAPETKVIVHYTGTVGTDSGNISLTQEFKINRFKSDLELETNKEGNNVSVSAKTSLGDGVKDRKWEFVLKKKDGTVLAVKNPSDEDRKAKATFSPEDFKGEKSATVSVAFTGKMIYNYSIRNQIALYRADGQVDVETSPPTGGNNGGPGPQQEGPKNDGPKNEGPKDEQIANSQGNHEQKDTDPKNENGNAPKDEDKKDEEPKDEEPKDDGNREEVNKEAAIELNANVLKEQKKVGVVATLKNVEQPEGKWKLILHAGEKDEQVVEEDAKKENSLKKEFSIEKIEKETVKVIATFKGKDKKGKIDVTEEKEIKLKEDSKEDDSGKKDDSDDQNGTTIDEEKVIEKVATNSQTIPNGQIGGKLPKTATQYGSNLLIGILFLISGGIIFSLRRRFS